MIQFFLKLIRYEFSGIIAHDKFRIVQWELEIELSAGNIIFQKADMICLFLDDGAHDIADA